MIERALLSVWDKTGLDGFARGLHELGVELVASGGTARAIAELGIPVTRVDELTEVPELLGHRVVTLHPKIHAGILARPDVPQDVTELEQHGIRRFDLVCVNLYPFLRTASQRNVREEEAVEMIDIGGPAMLRAAAKNFVYVTPVASIERYQAILDELRETGEVSLPTRRELAAEAFSLTAVYEASIAAWFSDREAFPDRIVFPLEKVMDLRYGENPHQRGAFYAERGSRRHLLSYVEQLGGPELTFNNLGDLDRARAILREFTLPACVIVKHANPCGCGVAATIGQAFEKALASDPLSAFGCVMALNRPLDAKLAGELAEQRIDVLIAPGFTEDALTRLSVRRFTRILDDRERRGGASGGRDIQHVLGGFLVQDADVGIDDREGMTVMTIHHPDEQVWGDLLFAWRIVKHVLSNAIVIAKDLQILGVGSGQMSRVDAVRVAIDKAMRHGHDLHGSALASDAFFAFPDAPELALDAGVKAIIQPGGSKAPGADQVVVEAAERAEAAMIFTHRRHFRH